ncbi:hypothetical protein [Rickettsiella endosymbiont of Dermanyssus gallinae]|uniref:hypothetical protein n=1 Tax=Rickettsiella endosymbiont of Dermanyssus gallinae TaxID=2856608 RepID=UPI001C52F105|nr:hypothetical protein [Rickettsiella endosymbiont of Dermanyssus gallinae]
MLKFIGNYINTIKLKYKSIQQAKSYPFPLRIISQELANKDTVYTVQIVGKNLVFKLCATELFNDNQLLQRLSPFDLLNILNSSNKKTFYKKNNLIIFPCRVHYKIIAKSYDHARQQSIFILEITQANNVIQKKFTALEIVKAPFMLEKLSSQEIYDLGFTIGSETILEEIHKLTCLAK